MTVVQCWDDGVTADARLAEIFRRHGARATFNLNAGLHETKRSAGWMFRGTEVRRLGWDEMREVYSGFTIANHSLTHPHLEQIPLAEARREISEGRERLRQFFGQDVSGFVYPFGSFSEAVMEAVRDAGHVYARTTGCAEQPFPPEDPMAFHPCCHFLAEDFWLRYEKAKKGGVFYFWGHSYELVSESMWNEFEQTIARISSDPQAKWSDVAALFGKTAGPARRIENTKNSKKTP